MERCKYKGGSNCQAVKIEKDCFLMDQIRHQALYGGIRESNRWNIYTQNIFDSSLFEKCPLKGPTTDLLEKVRQEIEETNR